MDNLELMRLAGSLEAHVATRQVLTAQDEVQQEHWVDIAAGWRSGESNILLKSPTGVGKTRMAEAGISGFLGMNVEMSAGVAVTVTPRRGLLQKIRNEFEKGLPDTARIGVYYSDEKDIKGANVIITTYASLENAIIRGDIDPSRVGLAVFDEAHELLTEKKLPFLELFPDAAQLFMTATPAYAKGKDLRDHIGYSSSKSIRETAERGATAPFGVGLIRTHVEMDGVIVTGSGVARDYDEASLQKAINTEARNKAAVVIQKEYFPGQSAVAFCAGIQHAKDQAEAFRKAGITAEAVWGDQDDTERDNIFKRYEKGEIEVITNADLLIVGHDSRRTSVVHNIRPTLSPFVCEQRSGRGLRVDPNNPDKFTYVLDYIDEFYEKGRKPVSFAQVAEAAVITRELAKPRDLPFMSLTSTLEPKLEGEIEFVAKPEDVMWAVNNDYRFIEQVVPDEYKTLTRVSAETGISESALQFIVKNGNTLGDNWMGRDFEGPKFGNAAHYPLIKTWDMINLVMESHNLEMDDSTGELQYVEGSTPENGSFMKKLANLTKKVDVKILERVAKDLYTLINSDSKYFEPFLQ